MKKIMSALFISLTIVIGFTVGAQIFAGQGHYREYFLDLTSAIGEINFYNPYLVIKRALAYKQYFPDALDFFLNTSLVSSFIGFIGVFLIKGKSIKKNNDLYGSARWATKEEVKTAGLYNNKGAFLAHDGENYIRHDGPEHIGVLAPTRTGKGAGVIIPTILSNTISSVILDIKEENWAITAGKRAKLGPVLYLNLASPDSVHFNPLFEIRKGIHEVEDAQSIVTMLLDPEGKGFSHDHWRQSAFDLLVGLIIHVLYADIPKLKSLSGVLSLISRTDKPIDETLHEILTYPHFKGEDGQMKTHKNVAEPIRSLLNKEPAERTGVISSVTACLGIYRDPIIEANMADSDFQIKDLMCHEKPVTLYIVVSPQQIDRLRSVIRLIINQICNVLTESAYKERKRNLLMVLDEFQSLGKLETFERSLGYLAGYGIKAMIICQSLQDLKKTYGERTSILDNTHIRLFYAPNTPETAKYISESIGNTTVSYESESRSVKRGSMFSQSKNVSTQYASRPLLAPNEVMQFPTSEAIMFVGSCPPIRVKKITYYNDKTFLADLLSPPVLFEDGKRVYQHGIEKKESVWLQTTQIENPEIEEVTNHDERHYFDDDIPVHEHIEIKSEFDEELIAEFLELPKHDDEPELVEELELKRSKK